MSEVRKLKDVYLFTNGMVLVFDERGQQVSERQGPLESEQKEKILSELTENARITFSRFGQGFFEISRSEFQNTVLANGILTLNFSIKGQPAPTII